MNFGSWILWGFISTLILTALMAIAQQFRFTRMNLLVILGTFFLSNRDKANVLGFLIHIANGWIFSFVHVAIFESVHFSSWYFGATTGFIHGLIVMVSIIPILPGIHPRMASEYQTPTIIKQIEPPGFMGFHYGIRTPLVSIFAHTIYGIVLGTFYTLSD